MSVCTQPQERQFEQLVKIENIRRMGKATL
jgi:hypothetical protein